MVPQIALGEIVLDVVKKDIKNVHLSVHPPTGRVSISAPLRMDIETVRLFAISKLEWIRRQQKRLREQERESPREYLDRESHYVWGRRCLLRIVEGESAPAVQLKHSTLLLQIRSGSSDEQRQIVLEKWYRELLKAAVPPLLAKWEPLMGVKVSRFFVQRMKTKWGGCNPSAHAIRLNSELAKKPRECLEYIVLHEMAHLLEPKHNSRFRALMDQFMPKWRFCCDSLNRLPVRHENWVY